MDHLGSTRTATVAIGVCAKAANKLAKGKKDGGLVVGECVDTLEAAAKMKEAELKALERAGKAGKRELEVNPSLFRDPAFRSEAAELEANYGIERADFVAKTLKARGGPAFGRVLRSRFSAAEFDRILSSAETLSGEKRARVPQEEKHDAVEPRAAAPAAYASGVDGMRASLAAHLRDASRRYSYDDDDSPLPAYRGLGHARPGFQDVKPADATELMGNTENSDEATLFDVIHRKYRDMELLRKL